MAIWDGKIRWKLGGNVQPVRMICEIDWRSCPSAILDYIWSEIVTDVIDWIATEEMLWRVITAIFVLTILLYTIWKKVGLMTEKVISENMINDINFKLYDLEMRVNVLAYRLQYGAWPFLPKNSKSLMINEEEISPLKSTENSTSWFTYFLPKCITKNDSHGSKIHRENQNRVLCNRETEVKELYSREKMNEPQKCEEKVLKLESKLKDCEKFIKDIQFDKTFTNGRRIGKRREDKATGIGSVRENSEGNVVSTDLPKKFDEGINPPAITSPNDNSRSLPKTEKSVFPSKVRLTKVRKQLESLHTVLRTYGNSEDSPMNLGIKRDHLMRLLPRDLSDLQSSTESDEVPAKIIRERSKMLRNPLIPVTNGERISVGTIVKKTEVPNSSRVPETLEGVRENERTSPVSNSAEESPESKIFEELKVPDTGSSKQLEDPRVKGSSSDEMIEITSGDSVFPEMKSCFPSQVLDIIPEEQSGSSCNEQKPKKPIHNANRPESSDFAHQEKEIRATSGKIVSEDNCEEITLPMMNEDSNSSEEFSGGKNASPIEKSSEVEEAAKGDDEIEKKSSLKSVPMEPENVDDRDLMIVDHFERPESRDSLFSGKLNSSNEDSPNKSIELRAESSECSTIEEKILNSDELKESVSSKDERTVELLIDVPCFSLEHSECSVEATETLHEDNSDKAEIIGDENDLITLDVDDDELRRFEGHESRLVWGEGSSTQRIKAEGTFFPVETMQENIKNNLTIEAGNEDNESASTEVENMTLDALTRINDFWKKETLVEPIKLNEESLKNIPIENKIYFTIDSLFDEFIEKIPAPDGMKDINEIESPGTFRKRSNKFERKSLDVDENIHKAETKKFNVPETIASKNARKTLRNDSVVTTVYQSPYSVKSLPPKMKRPSTLKIEVPKNTKTLSLKARSNLNLSSAREDLSKQNLSKSSIELSQRRSKSYVTPRKFDASPRASCTSQSPCSSMNKRSRLETRGKEANSDCKLTERELQRTKSKSGIPVLKTRYENPRSPDFVCRSKSPLRSALTMSTSSRASEEPRSFDNEEGIKESCNLMEQKERKGPSEGQTIIYVNIVSEEEHSAMKVVNPREFLDYVKDRALKIHGTSQYVENPCASKILTIVCSKVSESEENRSKDIEISAKPSVVNTSTSISYFPKILYLSEETEDHEVKT